MFKLYILFLCILHIVCGNYFCGLKCGKHEHTVCKRKGCKVSNGCGSSGRALPLNDDNRIAVLQVHNYLRNNLALGQDTTAGNGKSANMQALSYDKEIEYVAQCWSNSCREGGKSHDDCRATKKFYQTGQNMYSAGSTGNPDYGDNKYLTDAIQHWYSEISMSNAAEIKSYKGNMATGHFTQVIWAKTTRIGCGRTVFTNSKGWKSVYIYCNYGTVGNVLTESVYERGIPCSECAKNTDCNAQYKGLCGKIRDLSEDTWTPPSSGSIITGIMEIMEQRRKSTSSRLQCSISITVIILIGILF